MYQKYQPIPKMQIYDQKLINPGKDFNSYSKSMDSPQEVVSPKRFPEYHL